MIVSQNLSLKKAMKLIARHTVHILLILSCLALSRSARADDDYDMGTPTLKEIWVDPVNGFDIAGRGTTRALALKSVARAWALIPTNQPLINTGYRIWLAPGKYSPEDVPSIFQSVFGTADYPVIFQAADDTGAVIFPSIDVTTCQYFYMIGIHIIHATSGEGAYAINFRGCDHILLRHCEFIGFDSSSTDTAALGASFYQCQHIYLEHIELANTSGSAVDMYASQYGHIKNSRIHHYGSSGILLRGGTAYFSIEANTLFSGSGEGIKIYTPDTGRGLDNMVMPWVHYEAYDIKCFNNIIHHTQDAGFSCNGGYNILFAHNMLYQTGLNNSLIVLGQGRRARSVDIDIARERIDSGAWGTWYLYRSDSDAAPIPNKNIFIYNNIFYNTKDSATASSHFMISGPVTAIAFNAACPKPSLADENVKIRGNIIWNGTVKELGITPNSGCGSSNPSCNETQLYSDNLINSAKPAFVNAPLWDFHPTPSSIIFTVSKSYPIPDFSWTGLPPKPKEPVGNTSNVIPFDRDSNRRNPSLPIAGVFDISTSSVQDRANLPNDISLLQNFPNPAHTMTTIEFQLSKHAHVILEVYDMLGAKIAALISEELEAGNHSVKWNTSALVSGKYFYRIETENMTLTKQMTIVK